MLAKISQHFIRIPRLGIFLVFLLTVQHAFPQGTWDRIDVQTTQNLRSVCFVDNLYGWVVGDSGTILHTTDGGNSWIQQDSPVENDIIYVFFLNQNLGWASAYNFTIPPYGTILLKTTNGGAEWTSTLYHQENIFITCIHYFDSLTGWMGGKPHALVKTTDGGINWTQAAIDTSTLAFFPVLNLAFLNQEVGFASVTVVDISCHFVGNDFVIDDDVKTGGFEEHPFEEFRIPVVKFSFDSRFEVLRLLWFQVGVEEVGRVGAVEFVAGRTIEAVAKRGVNSQ